MYTSEEPPHLSWVRARRHYTVVTTTATTNTSILHANLHFKRAWHVRCQANFPLGANPW